MSPFFMLAMALLFAEPPERHTSSGLALSTGTGADHGGFGLQALYYLPRLPGGVQVAPHVGVGYGVVRRGMPVPFFAGLGASIGNRHRFVLDGGSGHLSSERLSLHGTFVKRRAVYGLTAVIGYEFLSAEGVLFRILPLGWFRAFDDTVDPDDRSGHTLSMSLGWKLW